MAWICGSSGLSAVRSTVVKAVRSVWRPVRQVLLGRRFVMSLDRNREAADRLDMVLKEMLEQ